MINEIWLTFSNTLLWAIFFTFSTYEKLLQKDMFRRYMVDSVVYWAKEYHIDQYDHLMGIHDIKVIGLNKWLRS